MIVRAASTAVLAASCLSLVGLPTSVPPVRAVPAVSLAAAVTATPAGQVLALVNAERAKAGCRPVRLDARLSAAATRHSQDMARNNFFDHAGRDGSTFVTRIEREGYALPRAENIAAGNTTAQATMRQWMNSPGHRTNILDCTAEDMGLGVASASGSRFGTYWTQDFGLGTR